MIRPAAARLLGALALACTSLVMFGTAPAHACSCAIGTVKEYAEYAEVVFVGTITQTESEPKAALVSYDVEVDQVFKGQVGAKTTVVTASMSSTCGLPGLPDGKPLLFYVDAEDTGLAVTSCGGTGEARPGNLKAVTKLLGQPREPTTGLDERDDMRGNSDPGPDLWPWPAAAGAVLLAAAGGLLLRKRRET